MDTQHIGSKAKENLLSISVLDDKKPSFSFHIKGEKAQSKVSENQNNTSDLKVFVSADRKYSLSVAGESRPSGDKITPLFFERTDYELILCIDDEDSCDAEYRLMINGSGSYIFPVNQDKSSKLYTGIVNFEENVGHSDLTIERNGVKLLSLTIEVFPKKIDYRTDYKALKNDVSSVLYSLLFSALEKTYSRMILEKRSQVTATESLSILRAIYERIIGAVTLIISKPHHQLVAFNEIMDASKASRFDNRASKWIQKHPDKIKVKDGKIIDAGKIMATQKRVTYNTKENKYAKHLVRETLSLIGRIAIKWEKYIEGSAKDSAGDVVKKITKMRHELYACLEGSFFKEIDEEQHFDSMSLVFSMAPGYKDLYKYYQMLRMGLSEGIAIDEIMLSFKNVATLYEYWCFIKLNSIMRKRYVLVGEDNIKIDESGLFPTLIKSARNGVSKVRYKTNQNDIIQLEYNCHYRQDTVNQKPDNVFRLSKVDFHKDTCWEFIFDAKYRIKLASGGRFRYEAEDDDINTMHRYRDSILVNHPENSVMPLQRKTVGAFILYPYPDDEAEYRNHKNYKTIYKQNIGAFPFLPGHTVLLEQFLDQIVIETPYETLRRSPLPAGYEFMMHQDLFGTQDLLVVIVDNIEESYKSEDIVYSSEYKHFGIKEHSDVFKENQDTRFQYYAIIGKKDGRFRTGKIHRCSYVNRHAIVPIETDDSETGWYAFNLNERPEESGTWKIDCKLPENNRACAFASSLFVLRNSNSIKSLCENSKKEKELLEALDRLMRRIESQSTEHPYYVCEKIGRIKGSIVY